jgi:RimJ/RimL family protein N-acetyltransferase
MKFSNKYNCLTQNIFTNGEYKIVPLRYEDRLEIMKWRNQQIYHLRQGQPLLVKDQNYYFDTVVAELFSQVEPNQILFSFLENDICIGYGGLVHINWVDKNAEVSFIMETSLEKEYFDEIWSKFLNLVEQVAFKELKLHKIYVYAFDLRQHLYTTLENNKFIKEAVLNEHCFYENEFIDVVIHSKLYKK